METSDAASASAPFWIRRWMTLPTVRWIALLGLCAAYLQGAFDKVVDFPGAVAEMQHFGLVPAAPLAVATIVTELVGPGLILTGVYRWLGALWLAGFTLPDRLMVENAFFEHLGLVGGFILIAWHDLSSLSEAESKINP